MKVSNLGGGSGVNTVSKELAGGFIAPSTRYARMVEQARGIRPSPPSRYSIRG